MVAESRDLIPSVESAVAPGRPRISVIPDGVYFHSLCSSPNLTASGRRDGIHQQLRLKH